MTEPTMMCIEGTWKNRKTLRIVPISPDAPYVEGIFDPESKALALIGTHVKEVYQMMPKLDDNGDVVMCKKGPRANGKRHAEERRILEQYHEYYLEREEDIMAFLRLMTVNAPEVEELRKYYYVAPAPAPMESEAPAEAPAETGVLETA